MHIYIRYNIIITPLNSVEFRTVHLSEFIVGSGGSYSILHRFEFGVAKVD